MTRGQALLISLLMLFAFWYFSGPVFDWAFSVPLPWPIPDLTWKPLEFLKEYGILIGGVFVGFVMFVMVKNRGRR